MKLLVTGGAGYIGSHTVHQLVEAGHDVVVLDNLSVGHAWALPEKAHLIEGDVGNKDLLREVFSVHRFDGVLHFAAQILVGESVQQPAKYYRNNTVSALTLFETCREAGVRSVIFSSTAAVYGEPDVSFIDERQPLAPVNPYGASKMMSERILQDLSAASQTAGEPGMKYVILRYFNVAGARKDMKTGQARPEATHLVNVAAEAALGIRQKMFIHGTDYPTPDGTCLRDYLHVEDLARAHLDALEHLARGGSSDIFNVGYGRPYSVREVIDAVKKASGVDFKVELGPRREGDPAALTANNEKIRRILKWQPKFDHLDLICETALQWERIWQTRKSQS